jgi:hypothetical protein
MLESDIHLLELADGIKDTLINSGFSTIKSILECTTSDLSSKIGVDQYIAQIILEEAKRITTEMTKVPLVLDDSTFTPPAFAVKKEEILSLYCCLVYLSTFSKRKYLLRTKYSRRKLAYPSRLLGFCPFSIFCASVVQFLGPWCMS